MPRQENTLIRERGEIDRILADAQGHEGPYALTAARRVSELGGYLLIGTVESKQVYEPQPSVRYVDGGWKPRERAGILATYLPALAVTSGALGDPNEVLQRVRTGRPLTEVNAAFGWVSNQRIRGGFQPYMTLEAFDSLRREGPNQVGEIDVVEARGFEELPEEGLYFSPNTHERVGSFPVRGDDVTQMAQDYGLQITPPVLI